MNFAVLSLLVETMSDFDQLYGSCLGSKSTKTVLQKNMIPTFNKSEKEHVDLWGPHYLLLLFEEIYVAVFCCKFTQKPWIL